MSDNNKKEKLIQDYLNITLVNKELDIIDEILTDNTFVSTEFGSSIGKEGVKQNFRDYFEIFSDISIEIVNTFTSSSQDNIALYQFKQTATHNGYFKGIPPSGQEVIIDTSFMYRIDENKIVDYHVSADWTSLLKQICPDATFDYNEILSRPVLYREDKTICTRFSELDSTRALSAREVECLALWINGKSAKGIAIILGLSHRTIEFYLSNATKKMDCTNKQQLIDKIINLNIKHLFDRQLECIYLRINSSF